MEKVKVVAMVIFDFDISITAGGTKQPSYRESDLERHIDIALREYFNRGNQRLTTRPFTHVSFIKPE